MTFSIVARHPKKNILGVAVVSGSIGVGTRVPWIKKDAGAIATQAYTKTSYGYEGLKLLETGLTPERALKIMLSKDPEKERRQVLVIDDLGNKAVHTGSLCPTWHGHILKEGFICAGNLITGRGTLEAMVEAFERVSEFSKKLINALEAGTNSGGDKRGERSAALLIAGEKQIGILVNESPNPVLQLKKKLNKKIGDPKG